MNTFVTSVAVALTATALSFAASAPAQAYEFDGFYVGLQAGVGWGNASQPYGPLGTTSYPFNQADASLDYGFIGGGHVGYNMMHGDWVFGLEGDIEFSDVSGDDNGNAGDNNELDTNWDGSLRVRIGHTFNAGKAQFYVTGGLAFLGADSNVTDPPPETESDSATFTGWTLGAGFEVSLAPDISGRFEYRYAEYGEENVDFPVNLYSMSIQPTTQSLRIGVSFAL